jgi:hypothetical protein
MNRLATLALTFLLALGLAPALQASQPVVDYETAIPGYWLSHGADLVIDDGGNLYGIGSWYEDHSSLDILIFKLDADGNLLWTLPIVADAHDHAEDIALDSQGFVWVTGWTDSETFPIVGGMDDTLTGFRDAFLMKLDPADGTILYSTFLGGDYTETGRSIVFNPAGEIILVGSTGSTDFPTTPDAYQPGPSAPLYIYTDAFITRLSPEGDEILYSTYFGGFKDDWAYRVGLDNEGNIIFCGKTNADDFPMADPVSANPDTMFVSKLSADGSTLMFSTYLGGEDYDTMAGMAVGSDGSVYVTGATRSPDFPTTPGAFQEDFVGEINGCEISFPHSYYNCEDVFLTRLATDGSGMISSTFLAGSDPEFSRDITVDGEGCVLVTGYTGSADFPPDGTDYSAEIFVSKFDPTLSDLFWSVTVDSGSANAGNGITVDSQNNVYFSGAINVPAEIYVSKISEIPAATVSTDLVCTPEVGTLPFNEHLQVTVSNLYTGESRRIDAHIDVFTAGGLSLANWKSGSLTLDPGEVLSIGFDQVIPRRITTWGFNTFTLSAVDVTPAPFNQPPHPPSGDVDSSFCTVQGRLVLK